MKPVLDLVTKLGPARLAAMAAVTLTLIGFFAFVILRVSRPDMGVLFADLSAQDAAAVVRDLDARGIRYETRGDTGQTVMAPRADLPRLRMDLAGKGLPSQAGVGYEIFDKGDAFSSTNFVQNVNHLRALEGELSRSIRAIGRVQAARVHLVLPERRLFERDRELPSAAIVLKLMGDLDAGQVRAIRHLAASAVEGLKPERVSIVDERGRLLADGARGEQGEAGAFEEKQTGLERRLRSQIEEIVAGIVGPGRARVQVSAELDMNRVESRSETFDPESRVVRSSQTRTEASQTANNEGSVSVGNELPGAAQDKAPAPKDSSNKNEETTNYEISKVTRTEVVEGGRVKRLSVAVLVDGAYAPGPDGKVAYQPRPAAEIERIAALVRSTVGFDKARGDQIEVVNLRFAEAPTPADFVEPTLIQSLLSPTKEDVMRFVELGVLALLTLIVLLVVVRPLLRRVLASDPAATPLLGAAGAAGGVDIEAGGTILVPRENQTARLMEFAKINGQIQADTVQRVVDMVRASPSETVEVLRNWIQETP
ncbi:flagellar M-ring protein FliF [Methylobacterium sp. E-041]|uniref:flagellar basal-body MS-ring/collar protein FliF n=1 Tax=unclassified Methylobacterium TaxID=2615210 RepID=UPI0011CC7FB9|nr:MULTISPECIES: flagellar basal-body MS-ring/collar protein FliF [unclassified Methylobacterium]MCJ2040324.1 flagellar M-ring protein FliF [Methylobacterium sp. J-059]MCJ2075046.1 flagellar M-ring protein FliF [Methylobacterium sp. E-016]MCJ2106191.1 flagellar M-ring protein FliF [Methylobacterium sp. E-041]MCJ2111832.1 flagellar M-ring protein FliF [Methylobacterium sp. E-025]TXM89493.1 flagellar M-ring protein FliF [Methylobacterium sp. WL116]